MPAVQSAHKVGASTLNIRRSPSSADSSNIIQALPSGQIVRFLADAGNKWWQVKTLINGTWLTGFVHSDHVTAMKADAIIYDDPSDAIHMKEGLASSTLNAINLRANPLGMPNMPRRNTSLDSSQPTAPILKIIDFLDVEISKRYGPTSSNTYCNIYAYDYAYLNSVFIPRVWWNSADWAIIKKKNERELIYATTVVELNANSLHDWFKTNGSLFGWTKVNDLDALQAAANAGKIGIVTGKRKDLSRSGHICAVVPENGTRRAVRNSSGKVTQPLMSQAGSSNKKYFNSTWWTGSQFAESGFWVHA